MIPKEILDQALADYEKAVAEIQGMERWEAVGHLANSCMGSGLCYYLRVKFDVGKESLKAVFGKQFLGGSSVVRIHNTDIPTLTARLQLRINKLKELLEK